MGRRRLRGQRRDLQDAARSLRHAAQRTPRRRPSCRAPSAKRPRTSAAPIEAGRACACSRRAAIRSCGCGWRAIRRARICCCRWTCSRRENTYRPPQHLTGAVGKSRKSRKERGICLVDLRRAERIADPGRAARSARSRYRQCQDGGLQGRARDHDVGAAAEFRADRWRPAIDVRPAPGSSTFARPDRDHRSRSRPRARGQGLLRRSTRRRARATRATATSRGAPTARSRRRTAMALQSDNGARSGWANDGPGGDRRRRHGAQRDEVAGKLKIVDFDDYAVLRAKKAVASGADHERAGRTRTDDARASPACWSSRTSSMVERMAH